MPLGTVKKEQFELLCKDGTRRSVDEYKICNWGTVPSRAIVTSSATNFEIRRMYQRFLKKAVRIFHKNKNDTTGFNQWEKPAINNTLDYNRDHIEFTNVSIEVFDLYESAPRYGIHHNLIFSVRHIVCSLFISHYYIYDSCKCNNECATYSTFPGFGSRFRAAD